MAWWTVPLWVAVLLVGVFAADWGADQLTSPLRKVRRRWGLSTLEGAALIGLALASPEISINAASVIRGAGDVGLGLILGGNVLSLPLLTTIAYLASREENRAESTEDETETRIESATDADDYVSDRFIGIQPGSLSVVVLPYLALVALVGALTLPAGWRGLQPIDGAVLIVAYLAFLVQAALRASGGESDTDVDWSRRELRLAAVGLLGLAFAAYAIVTATEHLVQVFGISRLLGGLFVTAPIALAPEAFGTWHVIRSGQVATGAIDVITDGAVTLTLAMVPLSLVGLSIENFRLFWVSLAFVLVMPLAYAAFARWGTTAEGFARWEVVVYNTLYLVYLFVVVGWVLNVV